jgi:uncharacterized protein with von Willebrand factor type A (vWA) domain
MISKFDSFIKFGSIVDKDKRAEIATLIYDQLQGNKNTVSLSNDTTDNFATTIENILSNNETMLELCSKDYSLAEQVTTEIIDFINETKGHLQKLGHPFANEQNLLNNFGQINKDTFGKLWETTAPFVRKTYEQHILDTEFYYNEFKKSLIPTKGDKNRISFRSVKEHFTDKWGKLLFEKKLKWELDIIDREREEFCKRLYEQIDNLKKLQELLEPFTNEMGRLWDMSKSHWQKVNFDILKEYAKLLEQDKSLQKLAEMLGRMRQAEREYEEEIFADMVIKPAWKAEHAAKSELVGMHESDDISSMLPAEAALLADEETELLFYKKFAEKKLQTFEYQAKVLSWEEEEKRNKRQKEKEEKKGPFVICVDTSGSMHGTPETVAKTLCFALLKMAVRDNRKCYLISFSTNYATFDLSDFKNNLYKLLEFLSMSFHDGTDVEPAMQKALEMLETEDYKNADVIIVSDFVMDGLREETVNQINTTKEDKTKFHSLEIGKSGNKDVINKFDTNWAYDTNNSDCVLQLVRDIRR